MVFQVPSQLIWRMQARDFLLGKIKAGVSCHNVMHMLRETGVMQMCLSELLEVTPCDVTLPSRAVTDAGMPNCSTK